MEDKGLKVFKVKRVLPLPPTTGNDGAVVILGNEEKNFLIFVGLYEATAILKELEGQKAIRPLTHDLLHNILIGFDIKVKNVIISKIVDGTFCATLVLEQEICDKDGKPTGEKRITYIDARASDSIVIALKTGKDILVTPEVYEKVEDITSQLEEREREEWEDTDIGNIEFDLPDFPPEDDE